MTAPERDRLDESHDYTAPCLPHHRILHRVINFRRGHRSGCDDGDDNKGIRHTDGALAGNPAGNSTNDGLEGEDCYANVHGRSHYGPHEGFGRLIPSRCR